MPTTFGKTINEVAYNPHLISESFEIHGRQLSILIGHENPARLDKSGGLAQNSFHVVYVVESGINYNDVSKASWRPPEWCKSPGTPTPA